MRADEMRKFQMQFYSDLISEHEDGLGSVGQSSISQRKRFEKIVEIGNLEGKSVLDIGCGLGSFYDFLFEKNISAEYTGFDITPGMIEIAKKKHPEVSNSFQLVDVFSDNVEERYDYVVSIGVLNLPLKGKNDEIMADFLQRVYSLCKVGMAISMTSSLTKKPSDDTYYFDPSLVIQKASSFCQNLKLDHTFLPHDFVLFCYKESLYT